MELCIFAGTVPGSLPQNLRPQRPPSFQYHLSLNTPPEASELLNVLFPRPEMPVLSYLLPETVFKQLLSFKGR